MSEPDFRPANKPWGKDLLFSVLASAGLITLALVIIVIPHARRKPDEGRQRLPTWPVEGQVFINGKAATGLFVLLHFTGEQLQPNDLRNRLIPFGKVDDQGRFEIGTFLDQDGAPEGRYAIALEYY